MPFRPQQRLHPHVDQPVGSTPQVTHFGQRLEGRGEHGLPVGPEAFSLRTDDLIAQWEVVRAGLGIGFIADFVARGDQQVLPVLPMLKVPPLPVWLTVHREIRSSRRIRAVYDFLAAAVPESLQA